VLPPEQEPELTITTPDKRVVITPMVVVLFMMNLLI